MTLVWINQKGLKRVRKGSENQPVRCLSWGPAGMALINRDGRVSSLFGPVHGGATNFRQTSYHFITKWIILNDQLRHRQVVFKAHTCQILGKVENVWTQSLRAFLISCCVSSFFFCYTLSKVNCGCTGWITYLWSTVTSVGSGAHFYVQNVNIILKIFRANFCLLLQF